MAVTAMTGTVGFAPQNGKSTDFGFVAPSTWYRHKATLVDLAVQDEVRLGVPEVGGIPIPTFPYKAGVTVGGGMTIQPRLENTIGWLLGGAIGDVSTLQQGGTGVYDHTFKLNSTDAAYVPWMSFRKHIPRYYNQPGTDLGEIYNDCKILGFTLSMPNDAPITARVDVLGRDFTLDSDPASWTWDADFESFDSIPIGCETGGYVRMSEVSANDLPIVAATVAWQNVPLDPRQDRVFGSAFLEDITIIQRMLTFDVILKWNNPDLYLAMLTGATNGTAWTAKPFTCDLEIVARSPDNILGKSVPYSLKINASRVMLSSPEGIQLAGNQAIMMRLTGTAIEDPGNEYVTYTLTNAQSAYTWPEVTDSPSVSPSVSQSHSISPSASASPSV